MEKQRSFFDFAAEAGLTEYFGYGMYVGRKG